jgi:hypothetical protein
MRDKYYDGLLRKYGHHKEYKTPEAPRMTSHKMYLLGKGLPLTLENGVIKVTERGALVFIDNNNQMTWLIDVPDKILI